MRLSQALIVILICCKFMEVQGEGLTSQPEGDACMQRPPSAPLAAVHTPCDALMRTTIQAKLPKYVLACGNFQAKPSACHLAAQVRACQEWDQSQHPSCSQGAQ